MGSNQPSSVQTLSASPWVETPRETRTPTEPSLRSPAQQPGKPQRRSAATPNAAAVSIIACSSRRT